MSSVRQVMKQSSTGLQESAQPAAYLYADSGKFMGSCGFFSSFFLWKCILHIGNTFFFLSKFL